MLRRICAWCRAVLEDGSPGARTSHDCCEACLLRIQAERAELRKPAAPVAEVAPVDPAAAAASSRLLGLQDSENPETLV